jgi:excisionase family DNA binding protein
MRRFDLGGAPVTLDSAMAEVVTTAILPLAEEVRSLKVEVAALRAISPPRYGTVKDAARMLGVSDQTIRRKAELGEIVSTRIGRSVRIDLSSLRPTSAPTDIAELAREARGS